MKVVTALQGRVMAAEMDEPHVPEGYLGIRTEFSGISPGTEMGIIDSASEEQRILGYSAVGIVEHAGIATSGFRIGQRVACYGAPYTYHAERLSVPANLAAAVPDHVDPREAAFAGLGAIAIHALRTAQLSFGESVLVVGLGILGNLVAQIANAASYPTLGIDLNPDRVRLLRETGLAMACDSKEALRRQIEEATRGQGVDAVLLCTGGAGEEMLDDSLRLLRDRGRLVIVGDVKTSFDRGLMFAKEAQVLISRAGGPGRYDERYERDNIDYPIGYVRWTEGRNVAEYIRLLAEGRIRVGPLITHEYALADCEEAYTNYRVGREAIGTLLHYQR